jgi:hypothetical protein
VVAVDVDRAQLHAVDVAEQVAPAYLIAVAHTVVIVERKRRQAKVNIYSEKRHAHLS